MCAKLRSLGRLGDPSHPALLWLPNRVGREVGVLHHRLAYLVELLYSGYRLQLELGPHAWLQLKQFARFACESRASDWGREGAACVQSLAMPSLGQCDQRQQEFGTTRSK